MEISFIQKIRNIKKKKELESKITKILKAKKTN